MAFVDRTQHYRLWIRIARHRQQAGLLRGPFPAYRQWATRLPLRCLFGIFMFFIYVFSNPFSVPGRPSPEPFAVMLTADIGQVLQKSNWRMAWVSGACAMECLKN